MSEFAAKVREIEAVLHKANQALEDALGAQKTVRLECKACGRKENHPVKDHRTAVDAAKAQYAIVGDLMKHLERLRQTDADDEEDRPLRHLSQKALIARAKRAGLRFNPDGTLMDRGEQAA